ncbi:ubiquitin-like domain-containing protein ASCRUDRAFT_21999, partial [Ascoidea rubescens DSM 1968]
IIIKILSKSIKLSLETLQLTVSYIKFKIQDEENIPMENQKLSFNGETLENYKTLADYDIKDGSILHL